MKFVVVVRLFAAAFEGVDLTDLHMLRAVFLPSRRGCVQTPFTLYCLDTLVLSSNGILEQFICMNGATLNNYLNRFSWLIFLVFQKTVQVLYSIVGWTGNSGVQLEALGRRCLMERKRFRGQFVLMSPSIYIVGGIRKHK